MVIYVSPEKFKRFFQSLQKEGGCIIGGPTWSILYFTLHNGGKLRQKKIRYINRIKTMPLSKCRLEIGFWLFQGGQMSYKDFHQYSTLDHNKKFLKALICPEILPIYRTPQTAISSVFFFFFYLNQTCPVDHLTNSTHHNKFVTKIKDWTEGSLENNAVENLKKNKNLCIV